MELTIKIALPLLTIVLFLISTTISPPPKEAGMGAALFLPIMWALFFLVFLIIAIIIKAIFKTSIALQAFGYSFVSIILVIGFIAMRSSINSSNRSQATKNRIKKHRIEKEKEQVVLLKEIDSLNSIIEKEPLNYKLIAQRGLLYSLTKTYDKHGISTAEGYKYNNKAVADLEKAILGGIEDFEVYKKLIHFYNWGDQDYNQRISEDGKTKLIELCDEILKKDLWTQKQKEYFLREERKEIKRINDLKNNIAELTEKINTPDLDKEQIIELFANRAARYNNLKKYNDALADYSKVIELDPMSEHQIYYNYTLSFLKMHEEAIAHAEIMLKQFPSEKKIWTRRIENIRRHQLRQK